MKTIELIQTIDETVTIIATEDATDERAGKTLQRYQLQAALQNRDEGTDAYSARFKPETEAV